MVSRRLQHDLIDDPDVIGGFEIRTAQPPGILMYGTPSTPEVE